MISRKILSIFVLLNLTFLLISGEIIYQNNFAASPENWTAKGNAAWSRAARKNGCGSLVIAYEKDNDSLPSWQSPVIRLNGKAVKISFYAADNYLQQQDYSYSGGFSVKACDKNGNTSAELGKVYTEWDNSLVSPYMWGVRTEKNLIWKYYELKIGPGHDYIRLNFDFRGAFVRGRCYLSEVCVTEENETGLKTEKVPAKTAGLKMLLSTPAPGGVFFAKDSLRFDALLYDANSREIAIPEECELQITISDYEQNILFSGREKRGKLSRVQDPEFFRSEFAEKNRITPRNHGVFRLVLNDPAAKETGILFLLNVRLLSRGKILAQDTILYGVTDPFKTVKNPEKSYFFTRDQGMMYYDGLSSGEKSVEGQDFTAKTNSHRCASLDLSYHWSKYQKVYPGPIRIPELLPASPIHLYMPNIEQVRQGKMIPEGAKFREKTPTYYAGRKNRLMYDYNADAYADFIIEYVKKNRHAISHVIPAGLERPFSNRVLILQKKVYTELKKFDPKLQIGLSINFVTPELFLKHELYNYVDFLNTHMYGSAISFPIETTVTPYRDLYRQKLKKKLPPFTMTEGAMRPPPGYLNYASGTVSGIWSLIAGKFSGFYYYHQRNMAPLSDPDVTDNLTPDPKGASYDNYRFVQLVARPIVAPELVMHGKRKKWRWISNHAGGAGCSIMPTPATMAYINLIKNVDFLSYRRTRLCGGVRIYYFGDKTRTVCGLEMLPGSTDQILEVRANVPYICQDLLGRKTRIVPQNGISYLQIGKYPVTLLFEKPIDPKFAVCKKGSLQLSRCTAGAELEVTVPTLLNEQNMSFEVHLSGAEGLRKKAACGAKRTTVKLAIPAEIKTGKRTLRAFLRHGNDVCGILHTEVLIGEPLKIEVQPKVYRKGKESGIEVIFRNASAESYSGEVEFEDQFFSSGNRPVTHKKPFFVKAGGEQTVFFPVAEEFVQMNFNEIIPVTIRFKDGSTRKVSGRIHFRGVPQAKKAPVIDGNLDDWDLKNLKPIPFDRVRSENLSDPVPRNRKSPAECYAVWHGNTLYFAVKVKDSTPQSRRMDVNFWMDDNILIGLYPWRTAHGEKLNAGYYREHIGFYKDGTVAEYREGKYVPAGGPSTPAGAKAAIRRTKDGYIYEVAYPAESLLPLKIKPGSGFRLSMTNFDARGFKDVLYFVGELSYFAGAMVNYNTNPELWFEFIFTE
ncbi:MAG: hypothetical protein IJW23_03575 [Lentisphaeria bacterium]|nr:hypothetical protein [Lentisphaeria bacterium]